MTIRIPAVLSSAWRAWLAGLLATGKPARSAQLLRIRCRAVGLGKMDRTGGVAPCAVRSSARCGPRAGRAWYRVVRPCIDTGIRVVVSIAGGQIPHDGDQSDDDDDLHDTHPMRWRDSTTELVSARPRPRSVRGFRYQLSGSSGPTSWPSIRSTDLALRDRHDIPAESAKLAGIAPVALDVALELGVPESDAGLRRVRVAAALESVPEAAVYKVDGAVLRQHDVGAPGKLLRAQTESIAGAMQRGAHLLLGNGVLAADAGHVPAAALAGEAVGHGALACRGRPGPGPRSRARGRYLMRGERPRTPVPGCAGTGSRRDS